MTAGAFASKVVTTGRGIRLRRVMIWIAVVAVVLTAATLDPSRLLRRIDAALPPLALATLSQVAWKLRMPYPPGGRLVREPGFLACGVATVFMAAATCGSLMMAVVGNIHFGGGAGTTFGVVFPLKDWGYLVGLAVFVAWVVLGVVIGWRAEPTWSDRLGRAIGWAWVVLGPARMTLEFMILLNNPMYS